MIYTYYFYIIPFKLSSSQLNFPLIMLCQNNWTTFFLKIFCTSTKCCVLKISLGIVLIFIESHTVKYTQ